MNLKKVIFILLFKNYKFKQKDITIEIIQKYY